MQFMLYFSLSFVLSVIQSIQASSGHGLVNPQSACNIRCENGGMCAFSFDNPQFHSCICLLGVYEGDRCQFQVGVAKESSNSVRQLHHKTSFSQYRFSSPVPTSPCTVSYPTIL
ncbi:EGF-like domain protein [Dictyocaulus viviparus]|uniref:EGF-like domain protein n=1 Tax=Dictyocaulus viviparus TaxID=29172 RepID=A0A0D8XMP8_DICVI|nr:EGF-like domain protein [Dictyocaulus viviparus]